MEVTVTKEEILKNSNNYELGKLVRQKYWDLYKNEIEENPDEHVGLVIGPDGKIKRVVKAEEMNQSCEICGEPTYMISTEHLIGNNHLACSLNDENSYDLCIICGNPTSYKKNTHIDLRVGFIEGAGQSCDGSCRKK
jgi:hypothetical protein